MSKGSTTNTDMGMMQDCVKKVMSKNPNKSKEECVMICKNMMSKASVEERRQMMYNLHLDLPEGLLNTNVS